MKTGTKRTQKAQRHGHPASARVIKPAPVGIETGEANAEEKPAQAVAKYLEEHPEKRAKPRAVAPYPVVLSQGEKDKREVLTALGHDSDGKCPTGVDWRNLSGGAESPILKMPRELQMATWAAKMRMISSFNHLGTLTAEEDAQKSAAFPACGWWLCEQKDRLKADQWADLLRALKILKEKGIDPNGYGVAYKAGNYAEFTARAKQWPAYKDLHSFCQKNPKEQALLEASLQGTPGIHLLRRFQLSKWAAHPREGGGHAPDKPYQLFLNEAPAGPSAKWTPAVAGAILFLFGLGKKGTRLDKEIHRAQCAWRRGGELNARQKPTHSQMA